MSYSPINLLILHLLLYVIDEWINQLNNLVSLLSDGLISLSSLN